MVRKTYLLLAIYTIIVCRIAAVSGCACTSGDIAGCWYCAGGIWVYYGECVDWSDCSGYCENCGSDCYCYDDDWICDGCESCYDGDCYDDDWWCPNGEYCVDAECVECQDRWDCTTPPRVKCHNGTCVECANKYDCDDLCCIDGECEDCYALKKVSANEVLPCPECDNDMGGCYSTYIRIPKDYYKYTAGDPGDPGTFQSWGVCGKHDSKLIVEYITFCKPKFSFGADLTEVVAWLKLIDKASSIATCLSCFAFPNPASCSSCLGSVWFPGMVLDLFDEPCESISACNRTNYTSKYSHGKEDTQNVFGYWDDVLNHPNKCF